MNAIFLQFKWFLKTRFMSSGRGQKHQRAFLCFYQCTFVYRYLNRNEPFFLSNCRPWHAALVTLAAAIFFMDSFITFDIIYDPVIWTNGFVLSFSYRYERECTCTVGVFSTFKKCSCIFYQYGQLSVSLLLLLKMG